MNTLSNIKNMYKVYELLPSYDTSKQLILEPLSCVLKLSLLQYKPPGTKISVSKNSLEFNEPSLLNFLYIFANLLLWNFIAVCLLSFL